MISKSLDTIIEELKTVKKEYTKLEHNLIDTQLTFNFEEYNDREQEGLVTLGKVDRGEQNS